MLLGTDCSALWQSKLLFSSVFWQEKHPLTWQTKMLMIWVTKNGSMIGNLVSCTSFMLIMAWFQENCFASVRYLDKWLMKGNTNVQGVSNASGLQKAPELLKYNLTASLQAFGGGEMFLFYQKTFLPPPVGGKGGLNNGRRTLIFIPIKFHEYRRRRGHRAETTPTSGNVSS